MPLEGVEEFPEGIPFRALKTLSARSEFGERLLATPGRYNQKYPQGIF